MNDFDGLLTTDFGFKPQGKSAPMAASKASSKTSSLNFDLGSRSTRASNSFAAADSFDDLFAARAKPDASVNLDSVFRDSNDFRSKSVSSAAYDKPVYDDDIFDGVPGLKSSSSVSYDNVFAPGGSAASFDDLLGGLGKSKKPEKEEKGVADFDDLIPGFGSRKASTDSRWTVLLVYLDENFATVDDLKEQILSQHLAKEFEVKTLGMLKYFLGIGVSHLKKSISYLHKNMSKFAQGGRAGKTTCKLECTLWIQPLNWVAKMIEQQWIRRYINIWTIPDIDLSSEPTVNASKNASSAEDPFKVFESTSVPMDSSSSYFTDPLEEMSNFTSSRSTKKDSISNSNGVVYDDIDPFGGLGNSVPAFSAERNSMKDSSSPTPTSNTRSTSPSYDNDGFKQANIQADMSPKYEEKFESNDDIWLMVSEIPLFTQPTAAPPPSRPPPPRPVHIPKSGAGSSASANVRKKDNEFSSFPSSTQFSQGPKSAPAAAKLSSASQFDELEDFATGRNRGNDDEHGNGLSDEELEMNSAAAAMKEAMDRAEAKFRHAKEVRGRENTKAAKSKESVQLEKDGRSVSEDREKQERLDHEQQQKEREEKEQRRREREREEKVREQQRLEREMARHAVERATREARERAAAEARQRAERAAVEKANAEARKRAERAAVQRAQAEARERAAAEAKERAEKAAAEAKEREVRERAAAARAEPEARVKAERAAVERAAAEARERAAAQARERAAAAARMNQPQNDNDLESFFSTGARANSAPRPPRPSTSDSPNVSSSMKKASSSTNIVDDLSSIFGAAPSSSGDFQDVEGESEERRRARLERHQRAQERAAKALAEKNQRDLQSQREQAERHRVAETLDFEIKRWAAGKEGNLRALLSTLQYVLWPECGWQPVSLTDLITAAAVKKVYRKATLCIHPDKVQQKGANIQQKYIAEKVFDLLKEAWNKFNSEELF
uniref:UBA domain-containing protein 7 n=1 Tax=Cajanus cajan TaxID=3821 RepID=A0A151RY20_CAJCA|nr:UBA domain-containing protein 7 [Cajanus cajan]